MAGRPHEEACASCPRVATGSGIASRARVVTVTRRSARSEMPRRRWRRSQTDIERGLWHDPKRARETIFRDYATTWFAQKKTSLAPKTVEPYESLLRIHLLPAIGDLSLAELSTARIRAWHADSLEKTSRSNTAKSCRSIRAILNAAIEDDLILESPCRIKGTSSERSEEASRRMGRKRRTQGTRRHRTRWGPSSSRTVPEGS